VGQPPKKTCVNPPQTICGKKTKTPRQNALTGVFGRHRSSTASRHIQPASPIIDAAAPIIGKTGQRAIAEGAGKVYVFPREHVPFAL